MAPAAVESKANPGSTDDDHQDSKDTNNKDSVISAIVERKQIENVIVHPLVLLSVVDHFNRMGKVGHSRYN